MSRAEWITANNGEHGATPSAKIVAPYLKECINDGTLPEAVLEAGPKIKVVDPKKLSKKEEFRASSYNLKCKKCSAFYREKHMRVCLECSV